MTAKAQKKPRGRPPGRKRDKQRAEAAAKRHRQRGSSKLTQADARELRNADRRHAKEQVREEANALAMAEQNLGAGRPTEYSPAFARLARKFCLLGCKDVELATYLSITEATLTTWKKIHPEFLSSLKEGKDFADSAVVDSLYQRALGVVLPDTHVSTGKNGKLVMTPMLKHLPADTTAMIFWLKNRQSTKWRDRTEQVLAPVDDSARVLREQMAMIESTTAAPKPAAAAGAKK